MKNLILLVIAALIFVLSGCAPKKIPDIEIRTNPPGASVAIDGVKQPLQTPFGYQFDFSNSKKYNLLLNRDGYFEEEVTVSGAIPTVKEGFVAFSLSPSPLWEATTNSPATNNWIQVIVGPDLNARMAWQIMIDAVIKRSSNVKELNYESGYLQTKYTVKKFDTKNGEFLLRCQLIATLVSSEPLIYRIKDVAEWSGNGVQWHPYNRIFREHGEMITEIQDRLRSN